MVSDPDISVLIESLPPLDDDGGLRREAEEVGVQVALFRD